MRNYAVAVALAAASAHAVPDLLQFVPAGLPFGGNCLTIHPSTLKLTNNWCTGATSQLFEFTDGGFLRSSAKPGTCLQYAADDSVSLASSCDRSKFEHLWRVTYDGMVAAVGSSKFGKCLDGLGPSYNNITLVNCDPSRATQIFRSASIRPATGVPLKAASGNCVDWNTGNPSVYPYACHGMTNQVWDYTFDEELRVWSDFCLELLDEKALVVGAINCTAGNAARQRWWADEKTGTIVSRAKPGFCLDIGDKLARLIACSSTPPSSAVFSIKPLLAAREANMKRRRIHAAQSYNGVNCLVQNGDILHVHPCRTEVGYWWEVTTQKTIKVGDKCLEMPLTRGQKLNSTPCSGGANQQWTLDATTGSLTSPHPQASGKCVTVYSSAKVWTEATLTMEACNPAAPTKWQIFTLRQFTTMPAPSRADAQQEFCSSRAKLSGDALFVAMRNSLVYRNDLSYFVPAQLVDQSAIVEKLGSANRQVLVDLAELMCRVRDRDAELRPKLREWFRTMLTDGATRLNSTFNYVRLANLLVQGVALPSTANSLAVVSNDAGKAMANALKSSVDSNNAEGVVSFATSSDVVWYNQQVQSLCTAPARLSACGIGLVSALAAARKNLLEEIKKASANLAKTSELVTSAVLDRADAFISAYRANADGAVDSKTWITYAQLLVFGRTTPVGVHSRTDLLRTANNAELTMALALWPYFSTAEMTAWASFYSPLDTQLHDARRKEITRLVFSNHSASLEAFMDGRSSDMNYLATQVLPRVCAKFPSSKVCPLAKFHTITIVKSDLERSIWMESETGKLNSETQELGKQFAQVFAASSSSGDSLWTPTAVRLLFDSLELTIYSTKTLLATARPEQFLRVYSVLASYTPTLSPLLPYFTFLIDQVSVAHFNAINALVNSRDVNGMVAYLEPNRSVSDLGLLGMYVLPVVCNNPSNPDFSICKLQEFHAGLLQVVAFERSRKANVVSLTELAEVDVRKQLDVVDQESKQFEIITAIQDSANKVGAKIQEESDKIQAVIKAESAAIHSDIAASTQILYTKMGEEGRALQASIDVSTKQLEETIGSAVDTIRRDIAKNTKLLYDKMTAEARALQKIIDDNTKKLATQIGAEATATRKLVADATTKLYDKIGEEGRAIRGKIDESTAKLYNKIGDEGRAIRNKIDESTGKLYNKIGEEGEKTRDKIDSATQQLTNVVNTNTNLLSSKIDEYEDSRWLVPAGLHCACRLLPG